MIDPKRMQPIEEEADKLMDKLKALGFTALVLTGAVLTLLGLLFACYGN